MDSSRRREWGTQGSAVLILGLVLEIETGSLSQDMIGNRNRNGSEVFGKAVFPEAVVDIGAGDSGDPADLLDVAPCVDEQVLEVPFFTDSVNSGNPGKDS
jgi:hypothetical protein